MNVDTDLTPDKKKQLSEFYKAIKVASRLLPNSAGIGQKVRLHVDEILNELKKEIPDPEKIQRLTNQIQQISSLG